MISSPTQAVIIVIPVHNESKLLDLCLISLAEAIGPIEIPCEVRLVLDACTDDSAAIAARHPFPTVHSEANAVGAARAQGIMEGMRALSHVPSECVWIANTDADSVVPSNWLAVQLGLADAGADVIVGTVRPDFSDLSPRHQQRWLDTHPRGAPNGHTHGANLGIRASTYLEVGGFEKLVEHEDVGLVDACRQRGAVIAASDAGEVITSGRLVGRTPGGYAGYLREQDRMLKIKNHARSLPA